MTGAMSVALSLAVFLGIGLLYAWLAFRVGQRWGRTGLAAAWPLAVAVATAVFMLRIVQQRSALGAPVAHAMAQHTVYQMLPLWAVSFGLVTLVVQERVVAGEAEFSSHLARKCLAAFVGGLLLVVFVVAVFDVGAVLLHH